MNSHVTEASSKGMQTPWSLSGVVSSQAGLYDLPAGSKGKEEMKYRVFEAIGQKANGRTQWSQTGQGSDVTREILGKRPWSYFHRRITRHQKVMETLDLSP